MDKTGKVLVSFNVKNGQYAVDGEIKPLNYLTKFSKEKNLKTKTIYGDGELLTTLVNDQGFTGIIGMLAQDIEYNKDMGFMEELSSGLAEIKQVAIKEHNLYFETQYMAKGDVTKTKKVWVFGVEVQSPSESLEQNTDDINESNVEYPITIKGTNIKSSDGTTDYVNPTTGDVMKCYTYSKVPTDDGYDTFEKTVPVPTIKAE